MFVPARRGDCVESGGRSESERLSCSGAVSLLGLPESFLRKTAPRIPTSRIAAARPTCVSRFMVFMVFMVFMAFMKRVSGAPDPRLLRVVRKLGVYNYGACPGVEASEVVSDFGTVGNRGGWDRLHRLGKQGWVALWSGCRAGEGPCAG